MNQDQPEWLSIRVTIVIMTIFVLQSVIVSNSLWAHEPFITVLWLWMAAMSSLKEESHAKAISLAIGSVLGETVAHSLVVPWGLIYCCFHRNLYGMPTMGFLRLFVVLLVFVATAMVRK